MTMTEHDHDTSGLSEDDTVEIASRLHKDGTVDFLNLVSGRIDSLPRLTSYMPGMAAPLSPFLEQAGRFKREVGLPILHATRINDLATARFAIGEQMIDLVGMTQAISPTPILLPSWSAAKKIASELASAPHIVRISAIAFRMPRQPARHNCHM